MYRLCVVLVGSLIASTLQAQVRSPVAVTYVASTAHVAQSGSQRSELQSEPMAKAHASWRWPVGGFAIGAVLGAVVNYNVVQIGCDTGSTRCTPTADRLKAAALGGAIVGAAGAAIGATARWYRNSRAPEL